MRFLLKAWAKDHDFLDKLTSGERSSDSNLRDVVFNQIVEALRSAYPAAYIGSIVRQLADQAADQYKAPDYELIQQIEHGTEEGFDAGGFLARSVVALAFALKRANVDVEVLTTNYDSTISKEDERRKVISYFTDYFEGSDYEFAVYRSRSSAGKEDASHIPLVYLNGVGPQKGGGHRDAPVVGEADFFLPGMAAPDVAPEYKRWREGHMMRALEERTCLFVGSSLSDPDVLRALALTKGRKPRYAIVLAPDREGRPGGESRLALSAEDPETSQVSRAIARDLVCQRYLHLGVQPIMVDHPYQVPQLLTEMALRKLEPKYERYRHRLDRWWGLMAPKMGFETDGLPSAQRPRQEQESWREMLSQLKSEVRQQCETGEHPEREQVMLEVWVHNPKEHQLFLWATSESLWLHNDTAHECGIEEEGSRFGAQGVFRSGRSHGALIRPQRGRWEYHISIPLTLHGHQWHHLPVGAVSVLSSKAKGWLYETSQKQERMEKLEEVLQERINNVLDPEGALS